MLNESFLSAAKAAELSERAGTFSCRHAHAHVRVTLESVLGELEETVAEDEIVCGTDSCRNTRARPDVASFSR